MVKGYKATYNYKCRNQVFEVGQEYKIDKKPIICVQGFHYCENAIEVLNYYNFLSCFKLLEVEDLSNETSKETIFGEKSCTNHIKITREIVGQELLDLLEIEIINDCSTTKTFKINKSYADISQEIFWDFDHNMDTVDTIKGNNSYTDFYYYDKQRNLKYLTKHYGSKYIFTEEGFVNESVYGKLMRMWNN